MHTWAKRTAITIWKGHSVHVKANRYDLHSFKWESCMLSIEISPRKHGLQNNFMAVCFRTQWAANTSRQFLQLLFRQGTRATYLPCSALPRPVCLTISANSNIPLNEVNPIGAIFIPTPPELNLKTVKRIVLLGGKHICVLANTQAPCIIPPSLEPVTGCWWPVAYSFPLETLLPGHPMDCLPPCLAL